MHKLKQKLKSQTGASITFALLLFLVCAVVGSAVLVAGTAAAGRMSKIAEMDRRYYAVNSAARLLVETIEKETVTTVKTRSTEEAGDSEEESDSGQSSSSDEKMSFPRDAAKKLGYLDSEKETLPLETKFKLSGNAEDTEIKESIEVDITETINPDGSMLFEVSKGKEDDWYALRLTFELDKQETSELNLQKKTETITVILNWRLTDIETVSNKPQSSSSTGNGG